MSNKKKLAAARVSTLPVRVLTQSREPHTVRSWIIFGLTMAALVVPAVIMFLDISRLGVGICAMVMMLSMIFLKIPIAFSMAIPSMFGLFVLRGPELVKGQLATVPYQEVASWSLSVIPLFMMMGLFMWRAGLTATIFDAARNVVGWMPGGLAVGTNLAGTGLGAVSGSAIGTTYAIARSAIPEMLKAGYSKHLAIGSVIVAGLPGQLIPPSVMMVIYAGIAETPVGPQLLAGVGPGLLVSGMFTIALLVFAWKTAPNHGRSKVTVTARERLMSVVRAWPVPVIILVIIVGMFSGVFTATEAAAFAAFLSLIVAFIWKRKGGAWRAVSEAAVSTISSVGAIFLLLVGVSMLSQMFTLTGISQSFANLVLAMDLNRTGFLLLMMVVYLILGTFMEPLAMMMLTIPVLMPTLVAFDISLLWYGAFSVLMAEIAIVTPPVGILSFIIHKITMEPDVNQGHNISLNDVFKSAWYMVPIAVLVAVVLIFFPAISTWLPDLGAAK